MKSVKNVLIILALIAAILIINSSHINAKTLTVNTDTLKLRKEASTESTILELLNYGEKLEYIEENGDWYKVKIKGITGFVHKDYVKVKQENTNTNNVEENAINTKNNTETNNITNNVETNTISNSTVIDTNKKSEVASEGEKQENTVQTNSELTPAEIKEMKVSKDSNIYILPLVNANIIQNIKSNEIVTVISKTMGWAYIETDEVLGWIRQDVLIDSTVVPDDTTITIPNNNDNNSQDEGTQTVADTKIEEKTMYINNTSVYVRKGPSTEHEIVDSLILNNAVKVVAENGDWYKVEVAGKTGYIAKRLLSDKQVTTTSRGEANREEAQTTQQSEAQNSQTSNTSKGQQVVEYAKKYLGCKYVYGASGPHTFDCSGFTMYVLKNFGVTLSHSATAQSRVGTYIAKENLQPGDLVFFTDYETGNGIGHCGIYIGDGNFIHASSGTGYCVKISTLTSGSYLKRYETARRIVQ